MPQKDDAAVPKHDTQPKPETLDPTINVQNLLLAAVKRIDDLNSAFRDQLTLRHTADRELAAADSRRIDELRAAESRRVDEQAALREQAAIERVSFYEKLRQVESGRVDANRAEDQSNAKLAAERLATQVTLLANTQATTAETLRNQVATTAVATQTQLQQIVTPLSERIATLEQVSYKGQGREAVADPALNAALAALADGQKATVESIAKLAEVQQTNTGRGMGINAAWLVLLGAMGLIATILGIYAALKP